MTPDRFDVVIVGGGAAGCVLARRLSQDGTRRVALLEAGPELPAEVPAPYRDGWKIASGGAWTTDWGFRSEPGPSGPSVPLRRGRVLGGTSWMTRFAVRGPGSDFDAWAARGNPGWAYEDVLPAFRRLETDVEFGGRPEHGDRGPVRITRYPELPRSEVHLAALDALATIGFPAVEDHNARAAVGLGPMPMNARDGHRITTLDAYLPADSRPANLDVRTGTEVAVVVVRSGRAEGLRLVDGTLIEAGLVILSAGTYGSPPLLLRSGIGPAADLTGLGIEVVADLPGVGRNLADHPGVDLDSGWRSGPLPEAPVLHSMATFRSAGRAPSASPDLMFWLSDPAGPEPAFYFDPILLKPESRGSVSLRSADPGAAPRIVLPGLTEPRDLERLMEGYRLGTEIANQPVFRGLAAEPVARTASEAELRERVIAGAYSLPHVVGTCRMGPSPADGDVVDAGGRVHGIDGLIVADASIIPEPPAGYPHLITIMLAEHLAAAHAAQD
ncbi:MAG TPA: FAD-dependent oxidoreductase [Candidatus Limnocylindrales bacterium]|nr:FAD-dependent oxidoreductase [Candidatus Limnocylindrales bacterium]